MTVSPKVRQIVRARAQGRCERCGRPGNNLHHRKGRVGFDCDQPANLLLLCGSGTTGCHGWVTANPAAAGAQGLSVSRLSTVSAADVPVRLWAGRVRLTNDGRYCAPDREECVDQGPCAGCPNGDGAA